ncbi:preprotein translocase subunit SecG [Amphibiibacter pelophylacis]|uniref:Preprotein translocase subunit SecG n=1 Tax=Amphibiibacter pelophylacis TaxID=1799477 RepID=A0ACC6NZZ7_9BURK
MSSIWINVLVVVQIVAALAMIGLVLVQRGKGADMGVSFGSGASGSLFGATGSANFLSRSTAVCAVVFFASTVGLVSLNGRQPGGPAAGQSILQQAPAQPAAPAADTGPVIPTAPSAPAAAESPAAPAAPAADATAKDASPDKAPAKP